MVPNAHLASAPGKAFHPPILGTLDIHGGQVKIYRECVCLNTKHMKECIHIFTKIYAREYYL